MSVAARLKALRERSGLSVRKLAEQINLDFSRYAYFEDPKRFKKPHLTIDFARSLARVLTDHGIDEDEVMALAGVGGREAPALSAGEEKLLDRFRHLDPDQRTLLLQMAEQMERRPGGPAAATVHSPPPRQFREPEAAEVGVTAR